MPLTPEQFEKLVTKEYLDEKLDEKLSNLVSKNDFDKIMKVLDGIVKESEDHKVEHTANIGAHDRFEKRITRVEKHLELSPV
jgi:hypothetical protein